MENICYIVFIGILAYMYSLLFSPELCVYLAQLLLNKKRYKPLNFSHLSSACALRNSSSTCEMCKKKETKKHKMSERGEFQLSKVGEEGWREREARGKTKKERKRETKSPPSFLTVRDKSQSSCLTHMWGTRAPATPKKQKKTKTTTCTRRARAPASRLLGI